MAAPDRSRCLAPGPVWNGRMGRPIFGDDAWVDAGDRSRCLAPGPVRNGLVPQTSLYSGPDPPSGGVSRPPFAVIAPHWTQFDGVTCTASPVHSYTCAGHMCSHMRPTSAGTLAWTRMWLG